MYGDKGRVLGMVLAGGKGERLMPLTKYRAKPAVFFGGKYRIIDFALSNLTNSGVYANYVLVQFKSQSLSEHIERGWQFSGAMRGRDHFVTVVPAQMWQGEHWFQGTADAVHQAQHMISIYHADRVCIFAADHIYKMDVDQMLAYHMNNQADVTIAANVVPTSEATAFGCIKTDEKGRIIEFMEKPAVPPEIPGKPGFTYVSMGNYVFEAKPLLEALNNDADQDTSHDFGRDIIPTMVRENARVFAYDFSTNVLPHPMLTTRGTGVKHWRDDKAYWRDVGTLKAWWQTHMEILQHHSQMTLYNPSWPIRTTSYSDPPVYCQTRGDDACDVDRALFSEGCRILSSKIKESVFSRNCYVQEGSFIDQSIIGSGVVIGKNCRITKAIIDSHNVIPDGTVIGEDPEEDAKKYYVDPKSGLVVLGIPEIYYQRGEDTDD